MTVFVGMLLGIVICILLSITLIGAVLFIAISVAEILEHNGYELPEVLKRVIK